MTAGGCSNEVTPIQRCFPSGCIEMIVQLRGRAIQGLKNDHWYDYPRAILTGVCDHAAQWIAYGGNETLGVRFTPEGARQLFNPPLKDYQNSFLDAELLLGKRLRPIIDRLVDSNCMKERILLIENYLEEQVKNNPIERNYLTEAMRLIRYSDNLNISDLCKKVYVCDRQLQRSFQNFMGISPKTYHKVMRLYKAHGCQSSNKAEVRQPLH